MDFKKPKFLLLYISINYFSYIFLNENQNIARNYTKNRVNLHILLYFFLNIGKNTNQLIFLLTIIEKNTNQKRVIYKNQNLCFYTLI